MNIRVWRYQNVYCFKRSELWGFGDFPPLMGLIFLIFWSDTSGASVSMS